MIAWEAVIGIFAIMTIKLTALVVGYLIVRLGHDTLVRGISGEFSFEGEVPNARTKLTGASPGVFFVLMGAALGAWAVFVDKPVQIDRPAFENNGAHNNRPADDTENGKTPERSPPIKLIRPDEVE